MFGKRNQKSDIIIIMSMFSFNVEQPVVVPIETAEGPVEVVEDNYDGVLEEDYTTAEEPDFGDDV